MISPAYFVGIISVSMRLVIPVLHHGWKNIVFVGSHFLLLPFLILLALCGGYGGGPGGKDEK